MLVVSWRLVGTVCFNGLGLPFLGLGIIYWEVRSIKDPKIEVFAF